MNDNPNSPSRFRIEYSYEAGQLAGITYPSGMKVFYRRSHGRITGIDVQKPGITASRLPPTPFVSSLVHTALGQPKSWNWSNGDSAARTFDADGRLISGKKPAEYKGVAQFFAHLSKADVAAASHQRTGYLPVTLPSFELTENDDR